MQRIYPRWRDQVSQLGTQLAYLPRTWRLIDEAAHRWTIAWSVVLVLQGLLPVAIVYLTRTLVNELVAVVEGGSSWMSGSLVFSGIGMAVALILTESLQALSTWIRAGQSERVQCHIRGLIHEQALRVDYAFYESPNYYDRLSRACSDAASRSLSLLENLGSLIQSGITLVAMGAVLLPYGWWVPLVLVISTFPALVVAVRANRAFHAWWGKSTPKRRMMSYYEMVLTQFWGAAEVRAFDLGPFLRDKHDQIQDTLMRERLELTKRQSLSQIGAAGFALTAAGATLAWMAWRILQGQGSLGDLALFYQAFHRGQTLMRTVLRSMGQAYSNSLFVGDLFEFLALDPQIIDPTQPDPVPERLHQGIQFSDVTFRYPGSERPVLQGFDLTLPANQIVAIVGDNGAGKSTLVKLLCRLYDPEAGQIELDGQDLRQFKVRDLRRMITVLFQHPVPYQTTVGGEIALGDVRAPVSSEEVERAAREAGAHEIIAGLPRGYNTPLGKQLVDGVQLSGGERQRIALARAFLRRAPIMILDEPTTYMDAWSEADWLRRFRSLAQGRTVLIITHHFTLAMLADVIYVMQEGQIVESGSHEELLQLDRRYAEAWRSQVHPETFQRK